MAVSHETIAAPSTRSSPPVEYERTIVDANDVGQPIFDALCDADCREILEATDGNPLSASEISAVCDLPLSTAYRKLDRLTKVDLLAEGIRLRSSGKHTSEYVCRVDEVRVSMCEDGGFELVVDRNDANAGSAAWRD